MYIESVPNRGSPPAILLRESFRDHGRVRKRTLANLSDWPTPLVEGFRTLLKGGLAVAAEGVRIRRALPHGHAAAVLGTIRAIGLDQLLGRPTDKRLTPLAIALIASRLVSPTSKLATARDLAADTACSSLGRLLGLGAVDESELYRALDWLGARQGAIETALARRHLKDGALVLYDVSSSWLEGRCCELARFGYSRDGKKGKLQIVYGLLCAADGCPVAVEVFEGNTADPMTLSTQIDKLKERFGLSRVVLVGDRGMITSARIRDELKPAGLDWITALRAPQIRALSIPAPSSFRCLTSATSPRSPPPSFPASAWSCARTRYWPTSGPASARICCRPPRRHWPSWPTRSPAAPAPRARTRSRASSAASKTATGSPSCSTSLSVKTALPLPATRPTSRRKRASTAFMSSAPASRTKPWRPRAWSAPIRASPASSAPSAVSRRSICTCDRSTIGWRFGCAPMSSCACSPAMSNGTCASASNPCCSTTTILLAPPASAPRSLPPRRPRRRRCASAPANSPLMAVRCTASTACGATSPPARSTR